MTTPMMTTSLAGERMETNLYRVSKICWAVTSPIDEEPQLFENPDDASEYLMSIGVEDGDIDMALIDMLICGNTRANFGTSGTFIFGDAAKIDGQLGTP